MRFDTKRRIVVDGDVAPPASDIPGVCLDVAREINEGAKRWRNPGSFFMTVTYAGLVFSITNLNSVVRNASASSYIDLCLLDIYNGTTPSLFAKLRPGESYYFRRPGVMPLHVFAISDPGGILEYQEL